MRYAALAFAMSLAGCESRPPKVPLVVIDKSYVAGRDVVGYNFGKDGGLSVHRIPDVYSWKLRKPDGNEVWAECSKQCYETFKIGDEVLGNP